jgi:hypothetical protein
MITTYDQCTILLPFLLTETDHKLVASRISSCDRAGDVHVAIPDYSNLGNCLILKSLQITEKVNSSFRIGTEIQQILEEIEMSISFFLFK